MKKKEVKATIKLGDKVVTICISRERAQQIRHLQKLIGENQKKQPKKRQS